MPKVPDGMAGGFETPLALWRERRGLAVEGLAAQVGITPSALTLYEEGTCVPRPELLERLAVALGVVTQRLEYGGDESLV